MLTRHEHVLLLHNDVRFSSDPTSGGSSFLMRHLPKMFRLLMSSMVYKDDPDHARLRRLVNKAFTPRMVQQMTGEIERIVAELLDKVEGRGSETVDLVAEVATRCRCRSSRPCSAWATTIGTTSTSWWSASSGWAAARRPTRCGRSRSARKLYACWSGWRRSAVPTPTTG